MNSRVITLSVVLAALLAPGLVVDSRAATYMRGAAELNYVKYDAEADGKVLASGSTLAQKYSLSYTTTNLYYRSQPRYYNLMLGYDWVGFQTKFNDLGQDVSIKQQFGKLRYNGDVGYNASELPIRFRAYVNNDQPFNFRYDLSTTGLIRDGLVYNIEGRGKTVTSGFFIAFEPEMARNVPVQGLPRMLLDYRETVTKSSDGFYRIDNKTKELAVAGLNKENNWVHFRTLNFVNNLEPLDQYSQQQIQIGLVDNVGRRKWSMLTNWIEFSADGQLTDVKSPSQDRNLEEYDVNFMAIATRKTWGARTFMNYNRQLDYAALTENTRIPIYLKGIYGSDTDWYLNLAANRGREQLFTRKGFDTSYTNAISAGGTTFKRSSFTLSPSLNLSTSKSFRGTDAYALDSRLETASTKRFSDRVGLAGSVFWRAMDDGANTARSKTWSNTIELKGTYQLSNKIGYSLLGRVESGNGSGYLDANRVRFGINTNGKLGNYLRNYVQASVRWTPSARMSSTLEGSYDTIKATAMPASEELNVNYRFAYDNKESFYRFDSKYQRRDNGFEVPLVSWRNSAEIQYRPDRYNDGLVRLSHQREQDVNIDTERLELLQRYTYNFYSRTGVIRNFANVAQEYSYISSSNHGLIGSTQYLMLSGRYSPTERLSLYGSARYEKGSAGEVVICYSSGISADFKLLSTSLDYTVAQRDTDNRLEKKLAASVRRTF